MTSAELLKIAKPILFNTEMVKAILEGRKTVTRRICKDGNDFTVPDMSFYDTDKRTYAVHNYADAEYTEKLSVAERKCPICPGDILYVRETWYEDAYRIMYKANYSESEKFYQNGKEKLVKWKPSIHMPKEAARIFLMVTDVRVERLQDITEEQAKEEGANVKDGKNVGFEEKMKQSAIDRFSSIWNSTIKKTDVNTYGWDANPWVWVIEFERIEPKAKQALADGRVRG